MLLHSDPFRLCKVKKQQLKFVLEGKKSRCCRKWLLVNSFGGIFASKSLPRVGFLHVLKDIELQKMLYFFSDVV